MRSNHETRIRHARHLFDCLELSALEHLPDLITQTADKHASSTDLDTLRNMACSSPLRQHYSGLTVLDVYDEAALIGKDFERIIEGSSFLARASRPTHAERFVAYGTDTIRDLVPKVIRILELLELQAAKNEKDEDEFVRMKARIERLESEKSETRELREKFDRELDLVEEQWRKEADSLMALVAKLQEENRRLRDELERHSDLQNESERENASECISKTASAPVLPRGTAFDQASPAKNCNASRTSPKRTFD